MPHRIVNVFNDYWYDSRMRVKDVASGLPKTDKLYLKDSYLKEAYSKIIRVVREKGKRYYLVLASSIFHSLGGGQPSDTGMLLASGFKFDVKKALESGGVVVLYGKSLEGEPVEGLEVKQELNWERRYLIMRLHTAGHVIDRAVSDTLRNRIDTMGALHGPPHAYVEYKAEISEDQLIQIEELTNDILDDREVLIKEVRPEELQNYIYGAPNLGRLPEASVYRIVEIKGINAIPCSGTHVSRTSEIGRIKLMSVDKVEGGSRLYYDVE